KATCDGFGRFATFAPQGDGRRLAWVSQHRDLAAVEIDGGAVHPGGARRDQKRDEIGDVLDFAEAGDAGLARDLLANHHLALAGLLHRGLDAPPLAVGLDEAWMDAVDLYAILLAAMGHGLCERRAGGVDRAADGERRLRLAAAGAADGD